MLKHATRFVLNTIEFDSFATIIEKLKTHQDMYQIWQNTLRGRILGG
jgi:hypothetical protein